MIPMVNLKAQYTEIKDEIEQGLAEAIANSQFILGPNVQAFEQETAAYLGVKHAIGVASGTDALHLALLAAGIGAGDEVITSAFTFIATAEAICYVGATPVFVDINPKTFNICPEAIAKAITPKTKAIMPVHLFGQPADMTAMIQLCEQYSLKLIEDACQSFGARINNKHTGTIGQVGAYSFFPSKNLGAFGDGGLIVTHCDEIATRIKQLRNHGSKVRYYHAIIGYNSRLDELQAVVLRAKLKRIDAYNQARRRVAHYYSHLLADVPDLITPFEDMLGEHVYHQYTVLSNRRDELLVALQAEDIAGAVYYPVPLHKQQVFKTDYAAITLPVTELIATQCFSLPICPFLTNADIEKIVSLIQRVLL